MARIHLVQQDRYEFQYNVEIQPRDINYGWHLSNESLVALIGTARVYMLRALDFIRMDHDNDQTGIIVSDLAVNFKAEVRMFDMLTIQSHIGEIGRRGFRTFHRVMRDDLAVALAESGIVVFDYATKQPAELPKTFLEALKNLTS